MSEVVVQTLSERTPATVQSVIHRLFPAAACFYVMAVLVLQPGTFSVRLCFLPITLWAAFNASTLDFAHGNYEYAYMNQTLIIFMFALSLRALVWTFRIDPYTRSTGSKRKSLSQDIWFDAFDLLFNLRGIGWSWPQGLRVPQETRNLTSTKRFLLTTLQWLVQDIIAFDFCLYTIQAMLSKSIGYPTVSIFDPSIPPLLRYVRSTIITIFMAILIHLGIRNHYNLVTLIGITVFQQPPSLWPPVSDRPYNATSLTQFWNTRWHQSFRDIFIQCGGRPLAHFLGKTGGILGGFLISGILHDIGCWGMGRGPDFKSISGFFLMNGVGIILERVYKTLTGKQVGGFAGRIWTFSWLLIWGSLLIDAWCKHGLGATTFWPTHLSPTFHVHKLLFP